jgi:GNAT superfamily N-acetyltransferase
MNIRYATPTDEPVITRYNLALAQESEDLKLDPNTVSQGVNAVLNDTSKGLYIVAEDSGQVVGQLMITYEWSDWRNGNIWWLQSVYVRPDNRGAGVFRKLLDFVRSQAEATPHVCGIRLYVHRENQAARKTYVRLGFLATEYEIQELELRRSTAIKPGAS